MKKSTLILLITALVFSIEFESNSQRRNTSNNSSQPKSLLADSIFTGLELRNIGPAFMSGRIADIAIHPNDDNIWYVAVGSGGVWKTLNAGVTWTPIFDKQTSYSIGCVTIDPNNPNIVWVGTGENVGGRHVGFGDGIYKSEDGGANWSNMGLKNSNHISEIVINPKDSDAIWVAAQGPLWYSGGDRGFYKSTDGGKSWKKTLGDSEWVGVTDIAVDPSNSDRIYAATWQRHRTVAAYMGGGPGTGLHRSEDGGETWTKLTEGLPTSNMGKIGIAISPQNPNIIYAAIELDRTKGGVFKSENRGATWEKQSDEVSGATGPHYYQELYASPHQEGTIYLMDSPLRMSLDGGKTFTTVNNSHKHVDNHAIAFRPDDPDYLLVGTDGGLYESFDLGANWRYMQNLPVTQFYKLALDNAEPFYNVYGGTQDNSSQGGPSRTDNVHGIQTSDWRIILGADGHQPATEPGNPDIVYASWQQGHLNRIDMTTGEIIDIQPQPESNESYERYNWDAPILVSPHLPTRLFHGSQRVWKSENRGDDWIPISGDLTRNQERLALPIMGRQQSWDNAWDVNAMSNYNTITSLAESPIKEGLIYAGTDDGIIQITEDGGNSWRKIEAGSLPGVPSTGFVNDIKADLFDENTVYVALDNHKYGDFKPYLLKSTDRGRTWQSIRSNLADRTLVWRLVQDHVNPKLLFVATEWGIHFSINGGSKWIKLQGGVPTISFRDLAIQRRENDLVGASFGRGFFFFDDYSVLREVSEEQLQSEATLFSNRKAWWYIQRPHLSIDTPKGSMGEDHYVAPNPPFGAVFTYYLKDDLRTKTEQRKEKEKSLAATNANIPFPGWDALEAEITQDKPRIWLTVLDSEGTAVRRIDAPISKGFHRTAWDLRYPSYSVISLDDPDEAVGSGMLAPPGNYTVTLSKQVDGVITQLSEPQSFEVVPLRKGALEGKPVEEVASFWRAYEVAANSWGALANTISSSIKRSKALQTSLSLVNAAPGELDSRLHQIYQNLLTLDSQLSGNKAKLESGEKNNPTIASRLSTINRGIYRSTYGPTSVHTRQLEIASEQIQKIQSELNAINNDLETLQSDIIEAGAPWVEGMPLPDN